MHMCMCKSYIDFFDKKNIFLELDYQETEHSERNLRWQQNSKMMEKLQLEVIFGFILETCYMYKFRFR